MLLGELGGAVVNVIFNMSLVRDIIDMPIKTQSKLIIRPALSSMFMIGVIFIFEKELPPIDNTLGIWIRLLELCILGGAVYIISIAMLWKFFGRPDAAEVDAAQMICGILKKLGIVSLLKK